MTRVAVIGPGAVGATIAAWLSHGARCEVVLCARTAFPQLVVETPDRAIVANPPITTEPGDARPVDWILVATKTYDAAGTARWFPGLVDRRTNVAILQNGVEHFERFSAFLPAERILPVVIDCPAERLAPGHVRQRGSATMVIPAGTAAETFAALFDGTAVDVRMVADWKTAAWRKLAINAAGAISAITLQPGGVVHLEAAAEVMRGLVREVIAVGRAEGAHLENSLVEQVIENYRRAPRDAVNSLLADRLAGRPMESEARNGVVTRLGRRHGLPTPFNDTVFACLQAIGTVGLDRDPSVALMAP